MLPYVPGLSGAAREGAGAAGGAGAGSPHPESCNNLFLSQKEAPPSAAARPDVLVLFCVRGPEGAEVRDAPARRQAGTQAERGRSGAGQLRQRGGRGGSDPGANARGCAAGTGGGETRRGRDGAGASATAPGSRSFRACFRSDPLRPLPAAPRWAPCARGTAGRCAAVTVAVARAGSRGRRGRERAVVRAGRARAGAGGAVDGATCLAAVGAAARQRGPARGAGACPAQARGPDPVF